LDDDTRHALMAFQRHFRPGLVDGRPDPECLALLDALIPQLP
jgi:N-acetylmuramoyl-L-alanine amidase